ncbi:MAG: hypothetical protein V4692_02425, partial [Bdellovibrionota bacterium]
MPVAFRVRFTLTCNVRAARRFIALKGRQESDGTFSFDTAKADAAASSTKVQRFDLAVAKRDGTTDKTLISLAGIRS